MSIRLMAEVWTKELDHPEQAILLALADRADDDGGSLYPSVGYLAWKTGYDRRSVQRILGRLGERGVVLVVREGGGRYANNYRLRLDVLPDKQPYRKNVNEIAADDRRQNAAPDTESEPGGAALCRPRGGAMPPHPRQNAAPGAAPVPPYTSVDPSIDPSKKTLPTSNDDVGSLRDFKLEAEEPAIERPAKKRRKTDEPDARVKTTIDAFDVAHKRARNGQPYVVKGGRDGSMLKRLPAEYSSEILVAMVDAYFADDSPWWAETRSREIPSFVAWLSSPAGGDAFANAKAGKRVPVASATSTPTLPPVFRRERDGTVRKYVPVGDL